MRHVNIIPMAGEGIRFVNKGYRLPKPLIPINGIPMVVRAAKCLPSADLWIFICKEDHVLNSKIEDILNQHFSSPKIISVDFLTEGQASTCLLAKKYLRPNDILTIGSCDCRMYYDKTSYNNKLVTSDALVWTFRNNKSVVKNPEMYGWTKLDKDGQVSRVSCKVPISNTPIKDHAITGSFSFKKAENFLDYCDKTISKNRRINDEFYLDIVLDECVIGGLNVHHFEVDEYNSWGTPLDLENYLKDQC